MVKVFFRGYGEWRINEDADGYKVLVDEYLASGVFTLLDRDERYFRHSPNFDVIRGEIEILCACEDPESELAIAIRDGRFDGHLEHESNFFKKMRSTASTMVEEQFEDQDTVAYLNSEEGKRQRNAAQLVDIQALSDKATFHINKKIKYELKLLDSDEEQLHAAHIELLECLNREHPMFSEELEIAIRAWNAVLKEEPRKPNKGSRRNLVIDWLNENYSKKLSDEAIQRIATMINPDRRGGAPKSI